VRLTAAFISHELRTQGRSLRFRTAAVLYVLAGTLPAVLIHVLRTKTGYVIGGASYAFEVSSVVPLLTAAFAFLLSMDGITREQGEGAWTTVTLCEVSNTGYLLRRWLALQALFLPLSALPFLAAAGIALADGAARFDPWVFAGPWLLHAAPLAMVMSALGIGVGTIGGGALSALPLLALTLALAPALLNGFLHRFGMRFSAPLQWVDFPFVAWTLSRASAAMSGTEKYGWIFPIPASEAGFDARVLGEQHFAAGALLAALAALSLGVATVYLRRTRPDVRPQRVRPGHPFRGFLQTWGRLRERYTPDPAPAPADRHALAFSLLVAVALFAALVVRASHYENQAEARFDTETKPSAPTTPTSILPGLWRIQGRIGPGSGVSIQVRGELINQGPEPAGHLSFQLNSYLDVEVTADSGRVTPSRASGRLNVELEPPIPPGGRRELRFRLSGEPAWTVFPSAMDSLSFAGSYTGHVEAQFGRDRLDFSRSYRVPSISGYRVELQQGDLIPVPRYAAWSKPEGVFPTARVELSISGPQGLFLADSCGGFVMSGGALSSRCRLPLADLAVAGGRHQVLQEKGQDMVVAVFPAHLQAAQLHLGFLARSTGMLEEAWPGTGSLGRLVVVERPDQYVHSHGGARFSMGWYRDPTESFLTVMGNLVFLQESDLIVLRRMRPESMLAEILSERLASRRRVAPAHNRFFRQFFRALARERLGLGPERGAVVGPLHPGEEALAQASALSDSNAYPYWNFRFPALVTALESRVGAEPLRLAVEEVLARGDDPAAGPGTAEELFASIARHSPAPVERLIQDGFMTGDLPYPVLEGVEFRRAADGGSTGWRVTGRMVNQGKGEALCKVVLTTDLGPESTVVRAGTGETAGFAFATRHRPQGVFLDPNLECHRLVRKGAPRDRVYFEGDGK